MKKKYNHKPRQRKSPSTGSQSNASAAPPKATGPQAQGPTVEGLRWYDYIEQFPFLPIKPPPDWNEGKDIEEYDRIWGESDDYWKDAAVRLKDSVAQAHYVLETGIKYFASKREVPLLVSVSKLSLRKKVALFTGLLPASADHNYLLRFSTSLARILWLESERKRVTQRQEVHRWLLPFSLVAITLDDAALDLQDTLLEEHDDFAHFDEYKRGNALLADC